MGVMEAARSVQLNCGNIRHGDLGDFFAMVSSTRQYASLASHVKLLTITYH